MQSLYAGYGAEDITPPLGTELSGYGYFLGRRAAKVLDPLWARCLALQEGSDQEGPALLICCDLVGLSPALFDGLRRRLAEALGIPAGRLHFVCTHTHTGPGTGLLIGCGEPDPAYLAALPEKILAAARAALSDLAEVEGLRLSSGSAVPVGYNRTIPNGPLDPATRGWVFIRRNAAPIAVAQHACHPVTLGPAEAVSADFPGQAVRELERQGCRALFINGPCGDVDPLVNQTAWGSGTPEDAARYGQAIARSFRDGLSSRLLPPEGLRSAVFHVTVPLRPFTPDSLACLLAEQEKRGDRPPRSAGVFPRYEERIRQQGWNRESETASVFRLSFGPVLLVGTPYELFTETGRAIREAFPGKTVLVAGNASSTHGYLPTRAAMEKGGYETVDSAFVYGRPLQKAGAAEAFAQGVIAQLRRLT